MEFQFVSLEIEMQNDTHTHTHTHTRAYLYSVPSWPRYMHYSCTCRQTSCCHLFSYLSPRARQSFFISGSLHVSLLSFPSAFAYLGTFLIKWSSALDTPLPSWPQSVCCLSLHCLPSFSHLRYEAVISALQCALPLYLPPSPLRPLPITPASLTLSLHRPPPSPSLSLNKAINSTLHACFTPSLCALSFPLPQHLPRYLFVLKNCRTLLHTPLVN